MYHSVKENECARFARQMDHLVHVAEPVYADFSGAPSRRASAVAVTFDDGYCSVVDNALPAMRARAIPATVFVPTQYLGDRPGWITNDRHRDARERVMTTDQLRRLRDDGVLIGSHGVSHRPLTRLSEVDTRAELHGSRKVLQEILGEKVDLFALPYGSTDDRVLRLAAEAGYSRVFLSPSRDDRSVPSGRHGYAVDRVDVSPTDWTVEYGLKIRGAYRWLPFAITAKRRGLALLRQLVAGRPLPA